MKYNLAVNDYTLIQVKASKLLGRMMTREMNLQSIF